MYDYEKEHIQRLRPMLPECTVLLRSNGAFPLSQPCPIAAYGKGVRHTVKGGTGSGDVNSRYFVTVEQGLENAGFTITTKAWLDSYDNILIEAKENFVKEVKAKAKEEHQLALFASIGAVMQEPHYELPLDSEGEAAIYVLVRQPGEGGDRETVPDDYLLSECEIRDILKLQRMYRNFMLVLNVGGPVDLSPLDEVENILLLSQLGVDTGNALADILLGKETPSGKLATTWVDAKDISPVGTFGDIDNTEYREGIYVGYRFFDTIDAKPRFPFGHGLSFTSFQRDNAVVSSKGTEICVSAEIKNTGAYAGKETLQVYVSKPDGKLDQPWQDLAAFIKTPLLRPGEAQKVTASFDLRSLSSYDSACASYVLEAGDYVVRIGTSSATTEPVAVLRLDHTVSVRTVKNLMGTPGFADWRPEEKRKETLPEDLPVLSIAAGTIPTDTIQYGREQQIEEGIKQLSDQELALLNVGNFGPLGGAAFMLGTASSHVSGASGESCGKVKSVPTLVMADGPAGLRIYRQFFRDRKGVHRVGEDSIMEIMRDYLPPWVSNAISGLSPKPKKGQKIEDQYVTAIPIGTAVAQSFNPEVAETCGDVVGAEMERFGVQLWLAPALNIHRNVLCGRTFEYYSEDPLISGCMAAAVTSGVQKHKGCGVTLKHFCANNQEDNRYRNNSLVSERAMREIYLRGFEIAIRTARPRAIMSSYNLLNGVHTSERRDLNTNILRDEFGFEGLIMTDWTIMLDTLSEKNSKYPLQRADLSAEAGTSVTMPGSKEDYKAVLKALKSGQLSRTQAELNASYLLRTAIALDGYQNT